MDHYLELFKTSGFYEQVRVPGGQTEGRVEATDIDIDPDPSDQDAESSTLHGQAYALPYQLEMERALREAAAVEDNKDSTSQKPGMSDVDDVPAGTSSDEMDHVRRNMVYRNYDFTKKYDLNLPITMQKDKIINKVDYYRTVIIEGYTGCGKTTQVPQYLLDDACQHGKYCKIVVTQPRRIAAMSIARRVSEERNWPLGSLVGYKVGLKEKTSEDTRIVFCTTGVLLQKLINRHNLDEFTHIILDEVHERNKEMDFVMLLVRKYQLEFMKNVKVILMSATMNSPKISEYFTNLHVDKRMRAAHVFDVGGIATHNVSTFYLDHLASLGIPLETNLEEPYVSLDHHVLTRKLIKIFHDIEQKEGNEVRGAVLIFLPGIVDIDSLHKELRKDQERFLWSLIPLHSSITAEEQNLAFKQCAPGYRKIILATNIAESSITVPDIKYVIDYCMTKELVTDNATNFTSLKLAWASKANCKQRAGRTGRVSPGRVYRLIPKEQYDNLMEEQIPEILRCPLEQLVLMSKVVDPSSRPERLLAQAIDPPDLGNIRRTIKILKETGGLLTTVTVTNQETKAIEYSEDDGDLTILGRIMAQLPVDIHISKMIALGHVFGVLEDCIIMGACMSVKNVFANPFHERLEAYQSKLIWSSSSSSDPIAFLLAYKKWRENIENGHFNRTEVASESNWARRYYLQKRSLADVYDLVVDIKQRLAQFGLSQGRNPNQEIWSREDEPLVLKIVLAGAFYPNYFIRRKIEDVEKEAIKTLGGRDPSCTVYLQGMPQNHPGELYTKKVKEMLQVLSTDMKITFDNTKKIYIEFPKHTLPDFEESQLKAPGHASVHVYRAIKLRQLGMNFELRILPQSRANERFQQIREPPIMSFSNQRTQGDSHSSFAERSAMSARNNVHSTELPSLHTTHLQFATSFIKNPGQFWVHNVTDGRDKQANHYGKLLNEPDADVIRLSPTQPRLGQLIVARYYDPEAHTNFMYRCRVMKVLHDESSVWVYFVDYGNSECVRIRDLYDFGRNLKEMGLHESPGLALECRLANIQPSVIQGSGQWSAAANRHFNEFTRGRTFFARIYSVVNSVVSLIVYQDVRRDTNDEMSNSLNNELVHKKYAQVAQESYLSQENRKYRNLAQENELSECDVNRFEEEQHTSLGLHLQNDPTPPPENETTQRVNLRGPFSPIEMDLYQLIRGGGQKQVAIDPNSVNSVLIDDDPQENFDRMVVAATVHASQDGTRLTLRQTTLLPLLPGLPALLCLLFAPQAELRTDANQENLTGGLFGLGGNSKNSNRPYFQEHDIELPFDTHITNHDVFNVNCLRFWLNNAFKTEDVNDTKLVYDEVRMTYYQAKVKLFLQTLLHHQRKRQTPVQSRRPYKWGQVATSSLLRPMSSTPSDRDLFQLHWGVALNRPGEAQRQLLLQNDAKLNAMCARGEKVTEAKCELCKVILQSLYLLKLHLQSLEHRHKILIIDPERSLDMGYEDEEYGLQQY